MEKRNLYKLDDFLILLSYLALIPIAYHSWPWIRGFFSTGDYEAHLLAVGSILGPRLEMIALYGAAMITTQILGRLVRYREKQSLLLLDYLEYAGESSLEQLAQNSGYSISRVEKLVKKMAALSSLNLRYEGHRVWLDRTGSTQPMGATSMDHSGLSSSGVSSVQSPSESPGPTMQNVNSRSEEKDRLIGELKSLMADKSLSNEERSRRANALLKENHVSLMDTMKILREVNPAMAAAASPSAAAASNGSPKVQMKAGLIILMIVLFFTPLWPVALVLIFVNAKKQKEAQKNRGNQADTT